MKIPAWLTLRAFSLSVFVHLAFVLLLVSGFKIEKKQPAPSFPRKNIIAAVSIDQSQVAQEIQRLKEIEKEKNKEEEEKREELKKLKKQADQAEKRRVSAEKKLKNIKKQTQEIQKRRKTEEKKIKEAQQQRARIEAEKRKKEKKKEERARIEKEKKAAAKRMKEEQEMQQEIAEEQRKKDQKTLEKYEYLIRNRITMNFNKLGLSEGQSCIMLIRIAPSGDVIEVTIATPSGNALFDKRAESAVYAASPLPIPAEKYLFERMRNIQITFKP